MLTAARRQRDDIADRSPRDLPFNVEAEQAVLGGLMLAPDALAKIGDWLDETAFFRRDHQMIYRAIRELADKGPIDPVTLSDWFELNGLGDLIGGAAYLIELANGTPSAANIDAYANIVAEKGRLRHAIMIGERLKGAALAPGAESRVVLAEAAHELAQLQVDTQRGALEPVRPMLVEWFQGLTERYNNGGARKGLPTPWVDLNRAIGAMEPGQLIILAARPSMGKTVLALQVALFTALRGIRTGYFSLEMTRQQLLDRAVACVGQVSYKWVKEPDQSSDEPWPRVTNAMALLRDAPLLIDETPSLSLAQVGARAQRAHMQAPLGLAVVDHLHEMFIDGEREDLEHGKNVRGLKALGKKLGCPMLVLAQLNRKLEERANKRPTMPDLRGSGAIEECGDLILFGYRDEYYNPESPDKGLVELIVGKGRDVEKGTVIKLISKFDQMRADDYDPLMHEPYIPATSNTQMSGGWRRKGQARD